MGDMRKREVKKQTIVHSREREAQRESLKEMVTAAFMQPRFRRTTLSRSSDGVVANETRRRRRAREEPAGA
jgi:hypothetical protein